MKRFKVRMRQRFEFPVDMLRYDGCWPATEEDSAKVACAVKSAKDWVELYVSNDDWVIELVSVNGAPTRARWASFGWEVVL